jgi:SAM-dependent methyltransferase
VGGVTTSKQRWLEAMWPLVRDRIPAPPARVLDVGCGPLGGFVPRLRADGYDAVGVDPEAPDGPHYLRSEFEHADAPTDVDAIVVSASLHHVSDPVLVVDRIVASLSAGGTVVVVEWAWERFDVETALWAFAQLRDGQEEGWPQRRRAEWLASGRDWEEYLQGWAGTHGLHRSDLLVRILDERLERRELEYGPYLFPELADTTPSDEQAAIDAGRIRPTRVDWLGVRR